MAKWITLLVGLALATTLSAALKCITCEDCKHKPQLSMTCPADHTVCMKTKIDGKIKKNCAPRSVCSVKAGDSKSMDVLKKLKTLFSDHDIKKLISETLHRKDTLVHCCSANYCNGSPDRRASVGLLFLLPFAIYLFG
ncbi:uncharacterized protein [Macrobrachium rosenbergii]|uniref:uncharacterized protein n=1 Tax=Macrobrachium rosenbergii TaxID=79674 RepID=UPI0034D69DCC